jgi:hypothetical protein
VRTYLFRPLSSGGASLAGPWLRFHIPLIELDMQISCIRLSDGLHVAAVGGGANMQPAKPEPLLDPLRNKFHLNGWTSPAVFAIAIFAIVVLLHAQNRP